MLRDERVLQAPVANEGIRVLWIDQVRGEPSQKAFTRIIGRWDKVRAELLRRTGAYGFVLRGSSQLVAYTSIGDTVVEVVRRRRNRPT